MHKKLFKTKIFSSPLDAVHNGQDNLPEGIYYRLHLPNTYLIFSRLTCRASDTRHPMCHTIGVDGPNLAWDFT